MIRDLIREKCGVRLSEVSVGPMFRKLGLSPQKPLRRAHERDRERLKLSYEKEFPRIRRLARRKRAQKMHALGLPRFRRSLRQDASRRRAITNNTITDGRTRAVGMSHFTA